MNPMRFNVGPFTYAVTVTPGPLRCEGPALAAACGREILLSGELSPDERLWALLDQLTRLHQQHYGILLSSGIPAFVVDVTRQLLAQGGDEAVKALAPAAGAARPVLTIRGDGRRVRCPHCPKSYCVGGGCQLWLRRHLAKAHGIDTMMVDLEILDAGSFNGR